MCRFRGGREVEVKYVSIACVYVSQAHVSAYCEQRSHVWLNVYQIWLASYHRFSLGRFVCRPVTLGEESRSAVIHNRSSGRNKSICLNNFAQTFSLTYFILSIRDVQPRYGPLGASVRFALLRCRLLKPVFRILES